MPPNPRLLHPVPVKIRKIERANAPIIDANRRIPIGGAHHASIPITLRAQISEVESKAPSPSEGGVIETFDGYLLFLTADLRRAGVTIDRGDRVIQIGEEPNAREVSLYITRLKYMGHYPHTGGPTLLRAYYEDRHPSVK